MPLKSQEAYLHEITGGFDNEKRREVRQLFVDTLDDADEDEDTSDMDNVDIAIGILEEFYSINIGTFTLDQAVSVVVIFKLDPLFPAPTDRSIAEVLRTYFNSPRVRIPSPADDTWTVPTGQQLEKLKTQFCQRDAEEIQATLKERVSTPAST